MSLLEDNRRAFHSALVRVEDGQLAEKDALSTLEFLMRARAFNEPAAVGAMQRLATHASLEARSAAVQSLTVIYLHGRMGDSKIANVSLQQLRETVNRAGEAGGLSDRITDYLSHAVPELSDSNNSEDQGVDAAGEPVPVEPRK